MAPVVRDLCFGTALLIAWLPKKKKKNESAANRVDENENKKSSSVATPPTVHVRQLCCSSRICRCTVIVLIQLLAAARGRLWGPFLTSHNELCTDNQLTAAVAFAVVGDGRHRRLREHDGPRL